MGKLILDKLYNRKGTDCVKWDHKDFGTAEYQTQHCLYGFRIWNLKLLMK